MRGTEYRTRPDGSGRAAVRSGPARDGEEA